MKSNAKKISAISEAPRKAYSQYDFRDMQIESGIAIPQPTRYSETVWIEALQKLQVNQSYFFKGRSNSGSYILHKANSLFKGKFKFAGAIGVKNGVKGYRLWRIV